VSATEGATRRHVARRRPHRGFQSPPPRSYTGYFALSLARSSARPLARPLAHRHTGDVTNMENLFMDKETFNDDIGGWVTSQVTTMKNMFRGADAFDKDITVWDTARVTDMEGMYQGATSFNQAIGKWDTSRVGAFASMFSGATSFNADLSGWDLRTFDATVFEGACQFPTTFSPDLGLDEDQMEQLETETWRKNCGVCPRGGHSSTGYYGVVGAANPCTACGGGKTTEGDGTDANAHAGPDQCASVCPPGTYSDATQFGCTECPAGKDEPAATACRGAINSLPCRSQQRTLPPPAHQLAPCAPLAPCREVRALPPASRVSQERTPAGTAQPSAQRARSARRLPRATQTRRTARRATKSPSPRRQAILRARRARRSRSRTKSARSA
jgi:surface protein